MAALDRTGNITVARFFVRCMLGLMSTLVLAAQGVAASTPAPSLAPGTKLELALLRNLQSGHNGGEPVVLMVTKNVADRNGNVIVERGTIVRGTVTWSRGDDPLHLLTRRPARLALTLDPIRTESGAVIPLTGDNRGKQAKPVLLTRDNTSKTKYSRQLDLLMKQKEAQPMMERLEKMFEEGSTDEIDDPEMQAFVEVVARELDLKETSAAIQGNRMKELQSVFRALRKGGAAAATMIAVKPGLLMAGAVLELADAAGSMGSRLSRTLSTRKIRAHVGTRVDAVVLGNQA